MNRRSTKRSLCSELVKVQYLNTPGTGVALPANLEEISMKGATLSLDSPLRRTATWKSPVSAASCEAPS